MMQIGYAAQILDLHITNIVCGPGKIDFRKQPAKGFNPVFFESRVRNELDCGVNIRLNEMIHRSYLLGLRLDDFLLLRVGIDKYF